jgi:hypothetical protein
MVVVLKLTRHERQEAATADCHSCRKRSALALEFGEAAAVVVIGTAVVVVVLRVVVVVVPLPVLGAAVAGIVVVEPRTRVGAKVVVDA